MGEMESLARVWLLALASLLYVYAVVARLPKNGPRLMASLPIAYLFLKLPWLLSTVFLRTVSSFFLVWLCSFRLALFCFDSGPLAENRDSLIRFLVFVALPIKAKQRAGGSTNKLRQQPPHLVRTPAASPNNRYDFDGAVFNGDVALLPSRKQEQSRPQGGVRGPRRGQISDLSLCGCCPQCNACSSSLSFLLLAILSDAAIGVSIVLSAV